MTQIKTNLTDQISLMRTSKRYYSPQDDFERGTLTRMEKIPTEIFESAEEASKSMAQEVAKAIRKSQSTGKSYLIAIGGGRTHTQLYSELVRMHNQEKLSFRNVCIFNLYEYYPLEIDAFNSNLMHLRREFLDHVDIPQESIFSPSGDIPRDDIMAFCESYEERIKELGGLDLAILGIGRAGNIAFNLPGSQLNSTSRLVFMEGDSKEEASKTFASMASTPSCTITMGIRTILSAKRIALMAWGEEKAESIRKAVEGPMSESIPASYLQSHPHATVYLDLGAARLLTRMNHPWLVTQCEWNDYLMRSAIVWLCQKLHKPVLKLTNKDYNENGLGELLATYGSAYDVNIKIFNDLQHTITGWPGGKPNADDSFRPETALPYPKKVVVFSPHPDDDVISMGGTIRRLVKQQHEVHVAYQTSGNIAVMDEEVTRFLHFINGFNQVFNEAKDEVITEKYQTIKSFLKDKKDGDTDSRDILTIKGLIRRGEARTACTYNGLHLSNVHFLDLPFYETGKIEKNPLGEEDILIVRDFLDSIQPDRIFIAADLADPHGTHKVCTNAVLGALDLLSQEGATWVKDCRIWMYRGAWAEWAIEDIQMAVPLSPEELREKRNAILKHQSQMESAPFLGKDERLFWQRSEDRNRATARIYDELGLACYEAMEAFVEYKPQE